MARPPSPLTVAVDARALDKDGLSTGGIGRYARSLLDPLSTVAAERGGRVVPLRTGAAPKEPAGTLRVWRPRVPEALVDVPEQLLLPIDVRRTRAVLHHALSIYGTAPWPGVPLVLTMHDVVPLMWPERYLRTGLRHRVLYRTARRARMLIAVSEAARRDVVTHLKIDPARVTVVHEAADERFRPVDPSPIRRRHGLEGPYVVYVGGLTGPGPRKGTDGLLDAFARWSRERGRTETLVMIGRLGEEGPRLAAQARRTGARIRFTGFVPDEELPGLYAGASCLVTASRYEGFGLPALEAISCGTPVAAYDVGAIPEVAGGGALLVADGKVDELLLAVERLCDDSGLRGRLAQAGLAQAGRFSWRRTAERTWEVYERVAAAGSRRSKRG